MMGLIELKPIGAPVGSKTGDTVQAIQELDGVPHTPTEPALDGSADVPHESAEDSTPINDEGQLAKVQLMTLNKQTGELYNMLGDNELLEGWVKEKLALSAGYITDIYNFLQYDKNKPKTLGSGEGAPAEPEHI